MTPEELTVAIVSLPEGTLKLKSERLTPIKKEMLKITNLSDVSGTLKDALAGADIFVGVSAPNSVTKEMVESMNDDTEVATVLTIMFGHETPTDISYLDLEKVD